MKAIASILLLLIVGIVTVGAGIVLTTFYEFSSEPATNSTDPVEIVGTGVANTPWDDIYDFFFGGLLGIFRWIVSFFLMPLMNVAASLGIGHRVGLSMTFGYIAAMFLLILYLWRKKDSIWEFFTRLFLWGLIILAVVFVLGLFVSFQGGV